METLVAGNTGYWNRETLKKAFGDSHIVIAGTDLSIEKESGIVSWKAGSGDGKSAAFAAFMQNCKNRTDSFFRVCRAMC